MQFCTTPGLFFHSLTSHQASASCVTSEKPCGVAAHAEADFDPETARHATSGGGVAAPHGDVDPSRSSGGAAKVSATETATRLSATTSTIIR